MAKTIVALYDDFEAVNDAIRDLLDRGLHKEDISIVANDSEQRISRHLKRSPAEESAAAGSAAAEGLSTGAGIGALVGGVGGVLAGIGALIIPVIGPVVAAGPLSVALIGLAGAGAGALAGGVAGGLVGALVDLGVPEETAGYYNEGLRRGGTLIVVRADEHLAGEVQQILNRHNPVDLADRSAVWQRTGWSGPAPAVVTLGDEDDQAFHRDFEASRYADREGYERYAPAYLYGYQMGLTPGFTDQEWEQVEARLRDDWHGRRYGNWEDFRDAIRFGFSRANRQREDEFAAFEDQFRADFDQSPHEAAEDYALFRPAYRFGWNMGTNPRYFEYEWGDVEENIRQNWEEQNPGTWDRFMGAIRAGWEAQREPESALPVTGRPQVSEQTKADLERQFIDLEHTAPGGPDMRVFEQHFNTSPWARSATFQQYEPAYTFGYNYGLQPGSMERDWSEIEAEARHDWERQRTGSWDQVRDAVRFGWDQGRRTA